MKFQLEFFQEADEQDGIGSRQRAEQFIAKFAKNGDKKISKDEFIAGGKAKIEKQLTKQVSKGKMTQEDKDATMARGRKGPFG